MDGTGKNFFNFGIGNFQWTDDVEIWKNEEKIVKKDYFLNWYTQRGILGALVFKNAKKTVLPF